MPSQPKSVGCHESRSGWWFGLLGLTVGLVGAKLPDPAELGLWQAATALDEGADACTRGDQVAEWLLALSRGLQVDDATAQWLEELRDGMLELDLQRTWKRLPEVDGDAHRVHIAGRGGSESGYRVTLDARGQPPSDILGDIDGWASLKPQPWHASAAFAADGVLSLSTHPIAPRNARSMAAELALALERAAHGTAGDATDNAIQARFRADFPRTTAALDSILTVDRWGRRLAEDVLQVDLAMRVDADRIAQSGHPALARFVRRMGAGADLSVAVQHPHGELGTVWIRSPGRFGIRFAVRNGALVPVRNGTPTLAHAVDIASTRAAKLALRPRGILRLKGTRLMVDHWTVPLRYEVSDTHARLSASLRTLPAVDFRSDGGLTGFMVASAGNAMGLEAHAMRFFEGISEGASGPDGDGSTVTLAMQPTAGHWSIDGRWNLLLLDNLVVRFAAQVLGHRIIPEDAVLDDLLTLQRGLMEALAHDWHAARGQVAAATNAQGAEDGSGVSGSK